MTRRIQECQYCDFFQRTDDEEGECRFNPPQMVVTPKMTLGGAQLEISSRFPTINDQNWCGKFQDNGKPKAA